MKEHEQINNEIVNELTNQAGLSKLRRGGSIMPEPGIGEISPEEMPKEQSLPQEGELSPEEMAQLSLETTKAERIQKFQDSFSDGVRKITHAENLNDPEIMEELENFLYYAEKTSLVSKADYEGKYKEKIELLRKLKEQGNLGEIKRILPDFSKEIRSHFASAESIIPDIPESLEDLAMLIMKSEGAQWKTGGKRELLDGEGKVNKENFLSWARKRMIEVHEFSPTETVDFFSRIFVKSRWSQVSLADMVLTGSYFLEKRKDKIIIPASLEEARGNQGVDLVKDSTTLHRNEDYEALKKQLLMEAFLFNTSRNNHVEYVANQFSESELAKTIYKLYTPNTFTRSNFLETIMSMPSMRDKEGEVLKEGSEIQDKLEKNFKMGQATRRLLLAYYYIYDDEMLKKLFKDPDSALFTEEYDKIDADGNVVERRKGTNIKGNDGKKYNREGWYENGRIKLSDANVRRQYLEFINVFTAPGPQKSEAIIEEVRERMVQSVMREMGLDYDEAKYAEAWAFSMTKWTGLGAKNDTGAVGHDAWTKALNAQEYRIRQMAEHRNALYGNIFNMLGMKRLGLNWFEGIRDESGRTIIEVIQGGEGSDMSKLDVALKELPTKVTFAENTMRGFASNHIMNSFQMVEFLIDYKGFNFQSMLTFDHLGRPVIDYEKANKIIGEIEKGIRYWASTWGGTDYSKEVRTWEIETKKIKNANYKTGEKDLDVAVAKNMPILMELLGPEVIKILKRQAKQVEDEELSKLTKEGKEKYLADKKKDQKLWSTSLAGQVDVNHMQSRQVREILWKAVFEYLVKAEIESHRNVYSDQERFNMLKMEAIYAFLKEKHVFTDEEISELRKSTHTTELGMFITEGGSGALMGGLIGAIKGFRTTTGKITKV